MKIEATQNPTRRETLIGLMTFFCAPALTGSFLPAQDPTPTAQQPAATSSVATRSEVFPGIFVPIRRAPQPPTAKQGEQRAYYTHDPILALIPSPTTRSIIHDSIPPVNQGANFTHSIVLLNTDQFLRQTMKADVWRDDRAELRRLGIASRSDIVVDPLPCRSWIIVAMDKDGTELGRAGVNLARCGDLITAQVKVPAAMNGAFTFAAENNRLEFGIVPQYDGVSVSGVTQTAEAHSKLSQRVKQALTSRRIGDGAPISSSDLSEITRAVRQDFPTSSVVYGENGSAFYRPSFELPMLELFREEAVAGEKLAQLTDTPEFRGYLATQLEALKKEKLITGYEFRGRERSDATDNAKTTGNQTASSSGGSISVGIPLGTSGASLGVGVSHDISNAHSEADTRRRINAVADRLGFTLTKSEHDTEFKATSFKWYRVVNQNLENSAYASNDVVELKPVGLVSLDPIIIDHSNIVDMRRYRPNLAK